MKGVAPSPAESAELTLTSSASDRSSGFYVNTRNDASSLRVLVIEHDRERARAMSRGLRRATGDVIYVKALSSLDDATAAMRAAAFDVVLVRIDSSGAANDFEPLERALTLAASAGDTAVIAMGHSDDVELAAFVCRKGAEDYLQLDRVSGTDMLRVIRCASERARRTHRLLADVYHDELTQLPNRRLLRRHFAEARYRAARGVGHVALLMIDLDGFKMVNDTLGHAAGDELLVAVAKRLRLSVRDSDLVARVGGDEFVVLANGGAGAFVVDDLRARIDTALAEPFVVADQRITVHASIGSTIASPEHGCELAAMLRAADAAMYHHKRSRHPSP